ncbi:MAG: viroplasmin family protein [Bacteroidales bacterium]|jgi:ribonuclease HI|nr:viroplasmin family protein [Bacteroidales bacterium]
MAKQKFYVVWQGAKTGIFDNWDECKKAIHGIPGAQYKSFTSYDEASQAFTQKPVTAHRATPKKKSKQANIKNPQSSSILRNSLSVDAACSGNPGIMEYRGVYVKTGEEVFKIGPYQNGTNNIGEFLALVHGLALLKKMNNPIPIYSDSMTAMSWVRQKKCKSKLIEDSRNTEIFELIARAEKWLQTNTYTTQILKWDTAHWGEIPADFGRK